MSLLRSIAQAFVPGLFRKSAPAVVVAHEKQQFDVNAIDRALRAYDPLHRRGLNAKDWGMSPMCRKMVRKNRLRAIRAGR